MTNKFSASHSTGHHHVRQNHVNGVLVFENIKSLLASLSFDALIPKMLKPCYGDITHTGIIFNNQHRFTACTLGFRRRIIGRADLGCFRRVRQVEAYRCTMTDLTIEIEMSSRLFRKAMNHTQAEASTFAFRIWLLAC